ncbi:MAG: metal ABC transporter ATP-binding protein [Phycisphaerales bacterium]
MHAPDTIRSDAYPAAAPAVEINAVEINHVSYDYPASGIDARSTPALHDVNFSVAPGTRLGILGPNGGGKSTLIKLILGLIKPTAGSIAVMGDTPAHARKRGIMGYLPQRIEADRDWPLSVRQVVALPLSSRLMPWQRLGSEDHDAVQRALDLLAIADLGERPIGALSGGQLQRAMIARAIVTRPRLLILDEPTVGIDITGQQRFGELINTLHDALDLTTIVVTHDMRAIAAVSDRVACLSRTLHFHDAPQGLTPAVLAQVFAHDVAPIFGEIHIDAHTAHSCDDPSHQHDPIHGGEGETP